MSVAYFKTLLQHCAPRSLLKHTVATMSTEVYAEAYSYNSDLGSHYDIRSFTTLDVTVAFDTSVTFVIPLVTLLTSSPIMWREEHLWNFTLLQRAHLQPCQHKVSTLTWVQLSTRRPAILTEEL
jgi:hypothetical protein